MQEPVENPQFVLDFAIEHYGVCEFFEDLVTAEDSMSLALGMLIAKIQEDLQDRCLNVDLQHYLDYFHGAFVHYHADDCKFAQVGPVHAKWTEAGPVPKCRCTAAHECTWH
jgi:hypothetical protein